MIKLTFLSLCLLNILLWNANAETVFTNVVQLKSGQVRGSVIDVHGGHKVEFYEALKFGKFFYLFC